MTSGKSNDGSNGEPYHILDPELCDPKRIAHEREKARQLKKSQWWLTQLNRGICHYCGQQFPRNKLTMDHVVPIARGGTSSKGNIVPACLECNRKKKLGIPVESIIEKL